MNSSQTILGIGNDLIAVSRIHAVMQRYGERFLQRVLCEEEIRYCMKHREAARHVAGRFAAKEALVKALGTGFQEGLTWHDFCISPNLQGKPEVTFSDHLIQRFGPLTCHLSISHCHDYAMATAIILVSSSSLS